MRTVQTGTPSRTFFSVKKSPGELPPDSVVSQIQKTTGNPKSTSPGSFEHLSALRGLEHIPTLPRRQARVQTEHRAVAKMPLGGVAEGVSSAPQRSVLGLHKVHGIGSNCGFSVEWF